jgi:hypothetical protein
LGIATESNPFPFVEVVEFIAVKSFGEQIASGFNLLGTSQTIGVALSIVTGGCGGGKEALPIRKHSAGKLIKDEEYETKYR